MSDATKSGEVRSLKDLLRAYGADQERLGAMEARMLAVERYIDEDRKNSAATSSRFDTIETRMSETQGEIRAVNATMSAEFGSLKGIVSGVVKKQTEAEEAARVEALVAERLAALGVNPEAARSPSAPSLTPAPALPVVGAGSPPTPAAPAPVATAAAAADAALGAAERGVRIANSLTPSSTAWLGGIGVGLILAVVLMLCLAWALGWLG